MQVPPWAEARISRRTPAPVQSGPALKEEWLLEFEPVEKPETEPLMGWISSCDMLQQVRLGFPSLVAALVYCRREGIPYTVTQPHKRPKRRSYSQNFESFEGGPSQVYPH
jgi:hypothetical protein